ncbi:MAG: hypothetical protein HY326_01635, partial [Chloroflexi bacterium]|nr:hypothetical protein [Chloroflexota bacterium]
GIGLAWDSGGATLPHQAATALIPILKAGMSGASGMPKASQGPHIPQFATWQQMSGVDWREIVRVAFFARVPTPNRVNTQGQVLATNLVLALLVTLVCGVCAEVLSHTLTHEQSSLENLLWRFPPTAVLLATWHAGTDSIRASNLYKRGSGVWLGAGIFLLYGLIFSFLDRDFTRFGPGSLYLFCAMTVSVALVSLAEDAARWWLARQWRVPASIEPRGTRLGLAVLAVVISRMLGMVPGILFGSYGRLHVPAAGKFSRRQAHWLALGGVLVILGLGLGFWVVTILTDTTSAAMLFLQGITPLWATLMGLQNLYLLIFIVALQTAFFQMVPVVTAAGGEIYRWNRLLWSVLFTCITFVLVHTQLNPGKVALDSFSQGEIQVLAIGLALLLITTLSIWGYFRGRPTPQAEISKTEISKTAHE